LRTGFPAPRNAVGRTPSRDVLKAHERDPLEEVAEVARTKREVLLRTYRTWLRNADLEDCLSQATLELLLRARRDGGFASAAHIANALEQKLCSRIHDRRRALGGRSAIEAALEGAAALGEPNGDGLDVADSRAPVHERVIARLRLRSLLAYADQLSADQRLALGCQVALDMGAEEFCRRFGWSVEKYRKVLQRGRARLRRLAEGEGLADGAAPADGAGRRARGGGIARTGYPPGVANSRLNARKAR
jgi:DNA-directed RNA polymerase specialized sigma24 family protein